LPECELGVPAGKSGVWNQPHRFCLQAEELPSPVITHVVGPDDSSWNLLLAELSRLSKIVEQSTNDRDHESSSTAALQLRER